MFKTLSLAIGLSLAALTAQATTVSLNLETGYVGPGQTIQNRIDLTSYLADYRIIGGSVRVNIIDDDDPIVAQTSSFGSRVLTRTRIIGGVTYRDYERNRTRIVSTAREQAELHLFGRRADRRNSTLSFSRPRVNLGRTCTEVSAFRVDCVTSFERRNLNYFTLHRTSLNEVFSATNIEQINTDGFLDYSVLASEGDFSVTGGTLSLTLEELPAAVPLPAGAVLLLSALGAAGVASRRRALSVGT